MVFYLIDVCWLFFDLVILNIGSRWIENVWDFNIVFNDLLFRMIKFLKGIFYIVFVEVCIIMN